jgi:hypothetical protein
MVDGVDRRILWRRVDHRRAVWDATTDRMRRLINYAFWEHDAAQGVVPGFVAEQLRDRP